MSALEALLVDQAGVISRRQVIGLGLTSTDINRNLRRRHWALVHPGVYVDHTGPLTWHQRAWAGVLFSWPAALSHDSAVRAGDGPGRRARDESTIHVAVDRHRSVVPARRTTASDTASGSACGGTSASAASAGSRRYEIGCADVAADVRLRSRRPRDPCGRLRITTYDSRAVARVARGPPTNRATRLARVRAARHRRGDLFGARTRLPHARRATARSATRPAATARSLDAGTSLPRCRLQAVRLDRRAGRARLPRVGRGSAIGTWTVISMRPSNGARPSASATARYSIELRDSRPRRHDPAAPRLAGNRHCDADCAVDRFNLVEPINRTEGTDREPPPVIRL